jgi:hypothetical protein
VRHQSASGPILLEAEDLGFYGKPGISRTKPGASGSELPPS